VFFFNVFAYNLYRLPTAHLAGRHTATEYAPPLTPTTTGVTPCPSTLHTRPTSCLTHRRPQRRSQTLRQLCRVRLQLHPWPQHRPVTPESGQVTHSFSPPFTALLHLYSTEHFCPWPGICAPLPPLLVAPAEMFSLSPPTPPPPPPPPPDTKVGETPHHPFALPTFNDTFAMER
jgi:hypothetical protein